MKKWTSLMMAAIAAVLLPVMAAAQEGISQDFPHIGMTVQFPEEYKDIKGALMPYDDLELQYGSGVYLATEYYIGMDKKEYLESWTKEDVTDEELAKVRNSLEPLLVVLAINQDRDFDALNDFMGGSLDRQYATPIGKDGGTTYFWYHEPDEAYQDRVEEEYFEEFQLLQGLLEDALKAADYEEPTDPYEGMTGAMPEFETTDTEGNPISSQDLFAQHKITMVNIWASWCGPCIRELPELEAIHDRLSALDCGVVGILEDGGEAEALETAKGLMEENGVTYPVLLPPEDLRSLFLFDSFPTTYFVDRTGQVVGKPVVGAYTDQYEETIDELLQAQEEETDLNLERNSSFSILVFDEEKNPVEGVTVQFCTEEVCEVAVTDSHGLAAFTPTEEAATIHLLQVPEGYAQDDTEYMMPEGGTELAIVLHP